MNTSFPADEHKPFCAAPFIEEGAEGLSKNILGGDETGRVLNGGEPCYFQIDCRQHDLMGVAVRLSLISVRKDDELEFKLSVFEEYNPLVLREAVVIAAPESMDFSDPFLFDPIPDSQGKTYNLVLDLPDTVKHAKILCAVIRRSHVSGSGATSRTMPMVLPYYPLPAPTGLDHNRDEKPLVSVLIVTYNSRFHIRRCLDSVFNLDYPNIEVIVVDNHSRDNTVDIINTSYPKVKLCVMAQNLGYCKANNIGVTYCRGEFIHILNPDTILVPDAITRLLMVMNISPFIATVGSLINTRGSIVRYADAFLLHHIIASGPEFLNSGIRFVAAPCGASFLLRKEVLEMVGILFDNRFEANWEDHDLGLRCWLHGYVCLHLPLLGTYHDGGGSFGFMNSKRETQTYRNHLLTYFKCFEPVYFLWAFKKILQKSRNRFRLWGVLRFLGCFWKYIPDRIKWQKHRRIDDTLLHFITSGMMAVSLEKEMPPKDDKKTDRFLVSCDRTGVSDKGGNRFVT